MLTDYFSFNRGEETLVDQGMVDELNELIRNLESLTDLEAKSVARDLDWIPEKKILGSFEWSYDAYKDGVAVEFECGAQTKARWAWMKFQLGSLEQPSLGSFVEYPDVEVGVLLLPVSRGGARLIRCEEELESGIFNRVLQIDVPLIIAEVDEV